MDIALGEQIYQALVARQLACLEPEVKAKLIEFWIAQNRDKLLGEGIDPDEIYDQAKYLVDMELEFEPLFYERVALVSAYLVEEIETQQEWDDNAQVWTDIGNQILGFLEWQATEGETNG